ncbi:MAG TPA: hypothetical protein VFX76_11730, partial [Roseiflexaceae bacterium]|nr:hypothetical protein [Roseiflexaceae bacterium]
MNKWRKALPITLVLLFWVTATVARAEDGGVDHVTLMDGELAPGAERVYQLKFGEGALRQGWLFALVGKVTAGSAELTLLDPTDQSAGQWRWDSGATTRWQGLTIPRDGDYRVRVANVGAEALRYSLYYDQSCFCVGKKMPLEGGVVIFQGTADPGKPVEAWLGVNDGMETSVQVAYRSGAAGRWPDDYTTIDAALQTDTQSDT